MSVCWRCKQTGEKLCGENGDIKCLICGKCEADRRLEELKNEEVV